MNMVFKLKLLKPFDNRRGGFTNIFLGILGSFAFIILISYLTVRGLESYAQSRVDTLCYRLTDAIASYGELNEGMQTDIYKGFDNLKFYTGDYTVEVYKYNYENYFNKEFVGSSDNGDIIPKVTLPRNYMIQVVYRCDETTLDKVVSILDNNTIRVGLASSSSAKVD